MKTSLKKALLLLGVAMCFGFSAYEYENDPGWYDESVARGEWCLNKGEFVELDAKPGMVYGYCKCQPNFIGQRCEYLIEP